MAVAAAVSPAILAAPEPETEATQREASRLERAWALGDDGGEGAFAFRPYKPNYILPVSYRSEAGSGVDGEADEVELAFQISFKTRLSSGLLLDKGSLWFGYSQRSYWQAYAESAPFRETNFEPELRYAYELDGSLWGWHPRIITVGLNHESNGRSGAESRSWNRVTGALAAERGSLTVEARGWWRVPESSDVDDNPGISDRVGRGQVRAYYDRNGQTLDLLVRSNFDVGEPRGAIQLSYAFPLHRNLRGYVRAFHGYGDSLIDFDERTTRFGIGVLLATW